MTKYQPLSKEVIEDIIEKFVKRQKDIHTFSPIKHKHPIEIKTKKR